VNSAALPGFFAFSSLFFPFSPEPKANPGKTGDTKARVRGVRAIPVRFSGYNPGNRSAASPVRAVRDPLFFHFFDYEPLVRFDFAVKTWR
jgi:hypothetical protein